MIKTILFFICLLFLVLSSAKPEDSDHFNLDYYSCKYLLNCKRNIDSIKNNVLIWTKENNKCKYDLIDSLTDNFINTGEDSYFYCLVAICNVADKSLYNSLLESNGMMFYGNFGNYITRLFYYEKHYHEEHCFLKYLIEALSLEVFTSKNQTKELAEIENFIESESIKHKFSNEQKQFLSNLLKRIDPSIWNNE